MYALDTNVVSELMRPEPDPRVLTWAANRGSLLRLTSITRAEIRSGLERLPAGTRRDRLTARADELFARIGRRLIDFDARAADEYGRLVASRERAGAPISPFDAQIAAVAIVHEAALVTRNTEGFKYLQLRIHNPWQAGCE